MYHHDCRRGGVGNRHLGSRTMSKFVVGDDIVDRAPGRRGVVVSVFHGRLAHEICVVRFERAPAAYAVAIDTIKLAKTEVES
jgi:hypothetical protein